jgi:hypothetical protein
MLTFGDAYELLLIALIIKTKMTMATKTPTTTRTTLKTPKSKPPPIGEDYSLGEAAGKETPTKNCSLACVNGFSQ